MVRLASDQVSVTARDRRRLVVDWTEDGQGLVLDPETDPMMVVGTHSEPDLVPVIDELHEQIARLQTENERLTRERDLAMEELDG